MGSACPHVLLFGTILEVSTEVGYPDIVMAKHAFMFDTYVSLVVIKILAKILIL